MDYFGPTKAEMKFRLLVSLTGLAMIVCGVALRGFPGDAQHQTLLAIAVAFLIGSALMSGSKLKRLEE